MTRTQHIARMAWGFILFWLIVKSWPVRWTPNWLWHAVLPHVGYYAFHQGPWWIPLQEQWGNMEDSR